MKDKDNKVTERGAKTSVKKKFKEMSQEEQAERLEEEW